MALVYHEQKRFPDAERLLTRALRIRMEGTDNSEIAYALNDLAETYAAQGRYEEAEKLHERALEIRRRELPGDHLSKASSLFNLARVYIARDRRNEAKPLLEEALAIFEKAPYHPFTAKFRSQALQILRDWN